MPVAEGRFSVQLPVAEAPDAVDGVVLGRRLIEKTFEGDLVGHSRGQMLSAVTAVAGSAGYVAIEQVSGHLHGRAGSFVLQHSGSMAGGTQKLSISVVPDSGSGALAGLRGTFELRIEAGEHYYRLEYALPG